MLLGLRTPYPLNSTKTTETINTHNMTSQCQMYQLDSIRLKLEKHYRDMNIEFTIQNGKLWMLQTRIETKWWCSNSTSM